MDGARRAWLPGRSGTLVAFSKRLFKGDSRTSSMERGSRAVSLSLGQLVVWTTVSLQRASPMQHLQRQSAHALMPMLHQTFGPASQRTPEEVPILRDTALPHPLFPLGSWCSQVECPLNFRGGGCAPRAGEGAGMSVGTFECRGGDAVVRVASGAPACA